MPAGTEAALEVSANFDIALHVGQRQQRAGSVSHSGMNEWPAPTTRTFLDRATIAASSASVRSGARSPWGWAATLPDQFDQLAITHPQLVASRTQQQGGLRGRWLRAGCDLPRSAFHPRHSRVRLIAAAAIASCASLSATAGEHERRAGRRSLGGAIQPGCTLVAALHAAPFRFKTPPGSAAVTFAAGAQQILDVRFQRFEPARSVGSQPGVERLVLAIHQSAAKRFQNCVFVLEVAIEGGGRDAGACADHVGRGYVRCPLRPATRRRCRAGGRASAPHVPGGVKRAGRASCASALLRQAPSFLGHGAGWKRVKPHARLMQLPKAISADPSRQGAPKANNAPRASVSVTRNDATKGAKLPREYPAPRHLQHSRAPRRCRISLDHHRDGEGQYEQPEESKRA